ncbi:MAG TPA: aldo/keto reductase [Dehalococcoidia bacterium]|jgi:aryl-alcohol dehydrogenase-like predicted oxidoreductase|nr:aldo/keto reductase [Dehalococcoidia bacterium]
MEQRTIGNTDLVTSTLGFGTWEMSTTSYGEIDVGEASSAVDAAIDHGITLFDTAEVYGPYHSEEILAKALGSRRNEVTLVTKVGFQYDDDGKVTGRNSTYDHIIERAEGCLRRLDTDVIDLLLIHWPDHNTPFEETMRGLEQLKSDGKIRHYGVSNFNVEMLEECERHGHVAANQVGYHLFDRRMEAEVLPYCLPGETGFMAYGSLGFGLLSGAFTPETTFVDWDWRSSGKAFELPLFEPEPFAKELRVAERLKEIAADYDKSLPQMALAWVLGNPAVSVALVGMRNENELRENVAAADWRLSDDDRAAIDRVFEDEGVPTHVDTPQAI